MACSNGFGHRGTVDTLAKLTDVTYNVPEPFGSSRRPAANEPAAELPEPPELERVTVADGRVFVLREIHVGDVVPLQRGFAHLSPEEVRLRFLHPLTELPYDFALRLCDLDKQSGVAFVLIDPIGTPDREIGAVARAYVDPTTLSAEFALVVQRRYTGQGIGTKLMSRLVDACRARGAVEIWGDVLMENGAMLRLCQELGFERHSMIGDPGIAQMRMSLV